MQEKLENIDFIKPIFYLLTFNVIINECEYWLWLRNETKDSLTAFELIMEQNLVEMSRIPMCRVCLWNKTGL